MLITLLNVMIVKKIKIGNVYILGKQGEDVMRDLKGTKNNIDIRRGLCGSMQRKNIVVD